MPLRRYIVLGVALVAFAAGSAQACPKHTAPGSPGSPGSKSASTTAPNVVNTASVAAVVAWRPRAWAPPTQNPPQAQGMRVAIDPVDGAMSMPPADATSQQLVIRDNTPVQVDRAPDGTLTAHLDDRWAEFSVATLGPEGTPVWTCVHGERGAAQFMQHPVVIVAPAPKWEDK